ncbi:hypothetical protein QFC24_006293 [Naganishia onofrii]|uniref:Uncharacterized protein n=1 Tax=Naganishia onofrii TaxID=1851511 RepID=A0ACC2X3N0_9TREE|nr:hypothetical protein QFC24_006293 [Naganishia onofrii]
MEINTIEVNRYQPYAVVTSLIGNGWRERSEAGTLDDPQEQMKMEEIEIVVLHDNAPRGDAVVKDGQAGSELLETLSGGALKHYQPLPDSPTIGSNPMIPSSDVLEAVVSRDDDNINGKTSLLLNSVERLPTCSGSPEQQPTANESQPSAFPTPRNKRPWNEGDLERLAAREAIIRAKMKLKAARKAEGMEGGAFGTEEKVDGGVGVGSGSAARAFDRMEAARASDSERSAAWTSKRLNTSPRPSSVGRSPLKPLILASSASVSSSSSSSTSTTRPLHQQLQPVDNYTPAAREKALPVSPLPNVQKTERSEVKDVPRRKLIKRQPSALELKYRSIPSPSSVCSPTQSTNPIPNVCSPAKLNLDQTLSSPQPSSPLQPTASIASSSSSASLITVTGPYERTPASKCSQASTGSTLYASLYGAMSPHSPVSPSPYPNLLTPTYTPSVRKRVNEVLDSPLTRETDDDEDFMEREFQRMSVYLVDPYQRSPSPRPVNDKLPAYKGKWLRGTGFAEGEEDRISVPKETETVSSAGRQEGNELRVILPVFSSSLGSRGVLKRRVTPIFRRPNVSTTASVSAGTRGSDLTDAKRRNGMDAPRDVGVPTQVWTYRPRIEDTFQGIVRSCSRVEGAVTKNILQNLSSLRYRRPSSSVQADVPPSPPPLVPLPPLPVELARNVSRPTAQKETFGDVTWQSASVGQRYGKAQEDRAYENVNATIDDERKKSHEEGRMTSLPGRPVREENSMDPGARALVAYSSPAVNNSPLPPARSGRKQEHHSVGALNATILTSNPIPHRHDRSESTNSILSLQDEGVLSRTLYRFPSPPTRVTEATAEPSMLVNGMHPPTQGASAQLRSSNTISNLLEALIGCSTPRKPSPNISPNLFFNDDLTTIDLDESFDSFDSDTAFDRQRTRQSIASLGASSCGSAGEPSTPLISQRALQDKNVMASPEIRISTWDGDPVEYYDTPTHRPGRSSLKNDSRAHDSTDQVLVHGSWEVGGAAISRTSHGKQDSQESPTETARSGSVDSAPENNPPQPKMLGAIPECSASFVIQHDENVISRVAHSFSSRRSPSLPEPHLKDLVDWGEPEILG